MNGDGTRIGTAVPYAPNNDRLSLAELVRLEEYVRRFRTNHMGLFDDDSDYISRNFGAMVQKEIRGEQ